MKPKPSRRRPALVAVAVLLGVIALWMGLAATMRTMAGNSARAPAAPSSLPVDWSIPDIDKLPNDAWGKSEATTAIYAGATVKGALHPDAAKLWLSYIHSPAGLAIFERCGFKPYTGAATAN
jgi:hypothetical protein